MNADYTQINADKTVEDFLYKELTYKLIGCFYKVYNELGPAHKEQIYHGALKITFNEMNINYLSKPRIEMKFHEKTIGKYEPDFIVDNKVIIEMKSLLNLPKVFEKQLFYYIRSTNYKVGYLVNFGNENIDIRRRVFDSARNRS